MKAGLGYSFARVFYGIFIIWYGIVLVFQPQLKENTELIQRSVDIIRNITQTNFTQYADRGSYVDLDLIKNNASDMVLLIGVLMIVGGFLTACGYSCEIHFVLCALILDLIIIHNIIYYRTQKMKINVLKVISLLGGAYFII